MCFFNMFTLYNLEELHIALLDRKNTLNKMNEVNT